jgi:phospholipase/lecithinase/hemolysin
MRDQLASYTGTPDGTELFVVCGGANDLFFDLNDGGEIDPEEMATNIAIIIIELYARGGQSFVVPNLPEFGDLPRYVNTPQEAAATEMSNRFNAALADWLDRLDGLPNLTLYRPDVAVFFNRTIANPPPPISNTSQPSWTGTYFGTGGTLVADPDTHVFWDEVHPTRISHGLLGDYVIGVIEDALATAE